MIGWKKGKDRRKERKKEREEGYEVEKAKMEEFLSENAMPLFSVSRYRS